MTSNPQTLGTCVIKWNVNGAQSLSIPNVTQAQCAATFGSSYVYLANSGFSWTAGTAGGSPSIKWQDLVLLAMALYAVVRRQ